MSSAERVAGFRRSGHGQLIATPATLALLDAGPGHLAVPVHRPFTLGTTRLELIPSGRGLGAAALVVDMGARTVMYAGAIRTVSPQEAADVRACDAVVVDAASDLAKSPALDDASGRLLDWVRVALVQDKTPVLVVDTVFDAIEIANVIVEADLAVAASKPIRDAAQRARAQANVPAMRAPSREPAPVIRLATDRVKLPDGARATTALVSLNAHPGVADAAFAWPFVADRVQLVHWIEQSRAKQIFLTGAHADAIASELGPRARVLGPPQQMALFG